MCYGCGVSCTPLPSSELPIESYSFLLLFICIPLLHSTLIWVINVQNLRGVPLSPFLSLSLGEYSISSLLSRLSCKPCNFLAGKSVLAIVKAKQHAARKIIHECKSASLSLTHREREKCISSSTFIESLFTVFRCASSTCIGGKVKHPTGLVVSGTLLSSLCSEYAVVWRSFVSQV